MRSLTRDVLLLGGAAAAFLLLAVIAPVVADEAPSPAVAAARVEASPGGELRLAANPAPASRRRVQGPAPMVEPSAEEGASDKPVAEPRCDRVRRIGKVTITRCD